MEFTTGQIAHLIGGEVKGSDSLKINKLAKIQEGQEGCISFLSNLKYEPYLYTTQASAVIVDKKFVPKSEVKTTLILVDDPYTSFTTLLEEYHKFISFMKTGVENPSFIGQNSNTGENIYRGAFSYIGNNCQIGKNVKIYPQAYIGDNVTIGDNTIIFSGVKIYSDSKIGSYCTFHSGAVIGSDGFGFAPQPDGTYKTIPQVGNVIIGNHVDIGANTVIDCATMGSTVIHDGVKLDNLIQIAHNVEIGKNTVIAAQSGISGSTKIGENCVIAGQVGIVGHITLANKTSIGAQSGVGKSVVTEGTAIHGSPAFEYKKFLKSSSVFRKLPELQKRIEELEEKIINLPTL
ncbi:MAG: UDP-3-O-(3-hydroxymyristoyl)glucosamine N-acyltransferase [Sporocytophaga sp.]|uniref:UDP-3-O-(3-hydroxymyristoyl)glucosamine N-acyltransferase n=1 Tax=Sporocytophaga sp. TaxID=2231183 RepID=UPI001B0F652F|nr:UDP-3-O-(3-hydroxymyristoyl)glucosamine N-acyltransferase [Sporocytophaga sp.]MBO9700972.1 UDP-3-O-(3-hydroxymyristoyl)glucosamine N-acyltransferase [Sporocytophaga sp.]